MPVGGGEPGRLRAQSAADVVAEQAPPGARAAEARLGFDSRSWIGELRCPTLIISADDDVLVDLADARLMAAAIRGSEAHCFEGVGHVPMLEQRDAFCALTLDFLRRHDGAPA